MTTSPPKSYGNYVSPSIHKQKGDERGDFSWMIRKSFGMDIDAESEPACISLIP